ncbi:universal stress protein [Nocardia aurantiaca]|uniref:Universal stress protein n=1 Tax=Nocardia aurantiaca TaxID=2675850 RepID=A0A6I3L9R8_9NOCA|nr:universal stress protein [Nocardia aurantiaca]MTE17175.1 universal stress protein [Nocardia aurantiaca]
MFANSLDRPIVVGVDASESALHAVRWAAVDAALRGAPLHLVFAVPAVVDAPLDESPVRLLHDRLRDTAQAALDSAAQAARKAVADRQIPDIRTFLVDAPAVTVLSDLAETAYFVVVGVRGMSAYHRSLLGSVSTGVARHAHGPVVVVPGETAALSDRPVVVGVDGSTHSVRALEIALDEASRRGVPLIAVQAWELSGASDTHSHDDAVRLLTAMLDRYAAACPGVEVKPLVAEGRPARILLDTASGAQLLVIGSHGTRGYPGMSLGSTGHALVNGSECPIALVRLRN